MALEGDIDLATELPSCPSPAKTRNDHGIMAVRYEETTPAKPPVSVTVAPPRAPPVETHPTPRSRPKTSDAEEEEHKRDSGLAPTASTITVKEGSLNTVEETDREMEKEETGKEVEKEREMEPEGDREDNDNNTKDNKEAETQESDELLTSPARPANMVVLTSDTISIPPGISAGRRGSQAPSIPTTPIDGRPESIRSPSIYSLSIKSVVSKTWKRPLSRKSNNAPPLPVNEPMPMPIEEFKQIATDIPTENFVEEDFMEKVEFSKRGSIMMNLNNLSQPQARPRTEAGRRIKQPSLPTIRAASLNIRVLDTEQEMESRKVRSLYEQEFQVDEDRDGLSGMVSDIAPVQEEPSQTPDNFLSPSIPINRPQSAVSGRSMRSTRSMRGEYELAGGLEDWEDINGEDVDRYGFINPSKQFERPGTPESRPALQRTSTVLEMASAAPRQRRLFSRQASFASSKMHRRTPSKRGTARSVRTSASRVSQRSTRSTFRAAANRLPGNRNRRWMDEAGDMLTLPPGLADIAEDAEGGKAALALKKKEWTRTEKWRKMAKVVKTGQEGEGMQFEFDTQSSKLIERTWKGIPDRWRSAAWYSFLSASAKKRGDMPSDTEIIDTFYALLDENSADDVQIDLDVPRTINRHIMFRRRYRGGQRLLFRILHCLSLYFPDTGYVQGMASLAATLLCYYDEEKAFIMLVRMWQLRGMDKLYEAGFPGLMAALDEFHKVWLNNRPVARKLDDMGIDPTAFGTRWYLTLFNYSIPFQAQLRVWDVFMLLGDSDPSVPPTPERPFSGGLDVLHCTAAALIDGTTEILMDSDFENAMKVLTSWIPIRDEELLMKVARVEWKMCREKKRGG